MIEREPNGRFGKGLPLQERFWAKVDRSAGPEGCWPWQGHRGALGYGTFRNGRMVRAHRTAYELVVGPVPDGLQLDHLCRNRACCNPAHLEPVTAQENTRRGFGPGGRHARQTACKNGHPFDAANTYVRKQVGPTRRDCRICQRVWRDAYNARRRLVSA